VVGLGVGHDLVLLAGRGQGRLDAGDVVGRDVDVLTAKEQKQWDLDVRRVRQALGFAVREAARDHAAVEGDGGG